MTLMLKKLNILCIYVCTQRGTPPSEVMDKEMNQPHLLRFLDDDLPTQYLVVAEQLVHVETT